MKRPLFLPFAPTARRTFIGNAYFKVQDPNLIGKMSGHVEGSSAFTRYRKIEDATLKEVIDLMGYVKSYIMPMLPYWIGAGRCECFGLNKWKNKQKMQLN